MGNIIRNEKGQYILFPRIYRKCITCGDVFFIIESNKKKYCSNECYRSSLIGKKRPIYIGKKISKTKKGHVFISEKQKEQIRKKLTGRKLTEETKRKMKEVRKGKGFSGRLATSEQHRSLVWRNNISKGLTGKRLSIEHVKKLSGANSFNWKGGITPINMRIRHSVKFRLWRETVFARDDWICQECKSRGGKLHPHHIKSFSEYPKLRFVVSNGITLCEICHKKTDSWGARKPRFDQIAERS